MAGVALPAVPSRRPSPLHAVSGGSILSAVLGLALGLCGPAASAQTPEGLPPSRLAAVEAALSSAMSRHEIPGLSVSVVLEGQLRWSNGYGLADLENFVPAKAGTVYRLGSVSKPMTAVAVLQLAEQGRLDLDAPIQKAVPSFPEKPWPVTARLLLAHLGGIRHYAEGEMGSTRHYASLAEGLDIFRNDPLLHQPGSKYVYSTYGYNLLGAAVEGASGLEFAEYLRTKVFGPAGMTDTRTDDVFAIIPNRAQGYARTAPGHLSNSGLADTSYKVPGGGLVSTASDVARFAVALQSEILLPKEALERMFTRQKTIDGKPVSYGLGWTIGQRAGHREVWHTGGQQRVSTILYTQPDRRLAVVLLTNLEGIGPALLELARQVSDILLR